MVGDFTYIFWDCPKIFDCWKNIQKEMKDVLDIDLTLDPTLYILAIAPETFIDKKSTSLLGILQINHSKVPVQIRQVC